MSGRVHDLITAENFAKWAEGRERIKLVPGPLFALCAVEQFLSDSGWPDCFVSRTTYRLVSGPDREPSPWWIQKIVDAFDNNVESGPALAKIARENAG